MKKSFIATIALIAVICLLCLTFVACATHDELEFAEINLAKNAGIARSYNGNNETVIIDFGAPKTYDTVILSEKADKITLFRIHALIDGEWKMIYEQDRIDQYRLCSFPEITSSKVKIEVAECQAKTKIDKIEIYNTRPKTKAFRVSAYMTTDNKVVQNQKDDEGFYGYFNVITDLILIGEISLDDEGNVKFAEGEDDFAADIAALREAMRGNNVKIYCSVGVRKSSNAATADFIESKIDAITSNLIEFTVKYGLEGVDYDWEYPENGKQWKAYNTLVRRTALALNPIDKGVTVALAPWGCKFSQDTVKLIDYVNLMTYDLFDNRGEHAGIYNSVAKSIKDFSKYGFTKEQIFLGLSFYGRTVDKSGDAWPDYNWDYAKNNASLGIWGNKINDYEYVDSVTKEIKRSDGYVNGYAMNRDKTAYAIAANLGGVMIFRSKCDAPYTYEYSLHRAVEETVNARIDISCLNR